jgi:pyridoxal phosphate enzyme (YggS family)
MTDADLPARIGERLAEIRERIVAAGGRDVEVLAVTKTFPAAVVDAAVAAGCRKVGENYAQEVVGKWPAVTSAPELHFIGQLQTNKVRMLAPFVAVWETVDRPSLVAELAKRVPGARVLVQVDTTNEPGKGGCRPADVPGIVDTARTAGLEVLGLMTVGPTGQPAASAAAGFELVRRLADEHGLAVCSMGMSDDFEVAVRCGATEVRIGSALVGRRPPHTPAV